METEMFFFVVTPISGSGSALKNWPRVRCRLRELGTPFEQQFTDGPGHATRIVKDRLSQGYRNIVVVGGDGTVNEVVNGFFDEAGYTPPDARLGLIPSGTGGDLVRTLGIPRLPTEALARLLQGQPRTLDVGRLTCSGPSGAKTERHFINIADAGLGGETAARVNRSSKAMGGFLCFLWSALVTVLSYHNQTATVVVDDNEPFSIALSIVAVANGQYFGGGMRIAPLAIPDDGCFDVVILHSISRGDLLRNLPRVYRGTHINHSKLKILRGRTVRITSDTPLTIQADGEIIGTLPAEFSILPGVLKVVC